MPGLRPEIDPNGLLEYSVVYTDRSLNHMSGSFQAVMNDISSTLTEVYNADAVAIVPGSGTFGMEAVARQFARDQHCLVVRNGWFSFRWTQILEMGSIAKSHSVFKARPQSAEAQAAFAPAPIDEVCAAIESEKPQLVFAPHVETSSGMLLGDDYLKRLSASVHSVGGLKDTVIDVSEENGFGICHDKVTVTDIISGIGRGLNLYKDQPRFKKIRKYIMSIDHSWNVSAQEYINLYKSQNKKL